MRVAIVSSYESEGGAAGSAYRLIAGLRTVGVEVDHFVERKDRANSSAISFTAGSSFGEMANDIVKRSCGAGNPIWRRSRRRRAQRALRTLLSHGRYDAINFHGFNQWSDPGIDRAFVASLADVAPLVWTLHDLWPLTGSEDFVGRQDVAERIVRDESQTAAGKKLAALGANLTWVGPSRWIRDLACQGYGSAVRSEHIPYGIDTELFRPLPSSFARAMWDIPEDVPVICTVAQQIHAKRKGIDILLEAIMRIREPVHLLLAGENRGLVIPPNVSVRIVEPIQDPRLLRVFYAAADVVAVPSREDNLPNVMLEAFACGVPVVGSRVGGIPDAVRPEETGWLADSEDIESWVVGLESALNAVRENPKSWRVRARSVAEREYSLAAQAERYRSLFEVVEAS